MSNISVNLLEWVTIARKLRFPELPMMNEPYVLIQHDCSKDNTKYRYEHKYPAQSNKINCTSYEYDLNLLELGQGNIGSVTAKISTKENRLDLKTCLHHGEFCHLMESSQLKDASICLLQQEPLKNDSDYDDLI
ncbi:hypothetical protein GCK72_007777 [Caenorhabditis remanei]|uniref:Uncharacterized protein n=1 Tax=Caenorhabditis remanei TaxID=31234 RepID=A0A6A5HIV8_CAERE|nr:hypothetical protein GCK72_007777 [Caenorhabditis remanei]KAF1767818.1 hypothetical protein GCK72_007777 [Caenorhabditis remanei]